MNSYWFSPSQPIIEASERQQAPGQRHLLWLTRLTLLAVVAGLTTLWLWRSGGLVGQPAWRALLPGAAGLSGLALLAGWLDLAWQTLRPRLAEKRLLGRLLEADSSISQAVGPTLDELQSLSPSEFEVWVQRLFESRGFHVINTPDRADHGIDLRLVAPDGEQSVVQCKRYSGAVGEPTVRDLYGVVRGENLPRGYLVTTGRISQSARLWAAGKPIELIDGQRLLRLAATLPAARAS